MTDQNFNVPAVMGGSWTSSWTRQVRRLFKIGIVVMSGSSKAMETLAVNVAFHFAHNLNYAAEVTEFVDRAKYHLIISLDDSSGQLKVRCFEALHEDIEEADEVFGDTALIRNFEHLSGRVHERYQSFLEYRVAESEGFVAVERERIMREGW